ALIPPPRHPRPLPYTTLFRSVSAGGSDVDRPVRRVVNGVDPGERAGLVRERGDLHDRWDGADGVRRPRKRDHPRSLEAGAHEARSEEYTSELQSRVDLVCRLL